MATRPRTLLKFDVVSVRIVEDSKTKKYVAYTIMIEHRKRCDGEPDPHPVVIERRYSDFLALYNALRKEQPDVLDCLNFPRKVLIGNFSTEMISSRSACFEQLLNLISTTNSLKELPAFLSFLYDKEMVLAHSLIEKELYEAAKPVVENSFWTLSKFWTDRTPAVLRCLCLLVAIMAKTRDPNSLSLSSLALHRYQAVSDVDLLKYYVPLLQTVKEVSALRGQDISMLTQHLDELKKKGYKVSGAPSLLQVVMSDLQELINKI